MRWAPLRGLGVWWVVAAVTVVGMVMISFGGRVRLGGFVVAASLVLAAVLRLLIPRGRGGGLEIRSRWRDVVTMLIAATLVFVAFFLVRTCGPESLQLGGGRADNCGP